MTLYFEHESAEINETICLLQVTANMGTHHHRFKVVMIVEDTHTHL